MIERRVTSVTVQTVAADELPVAPQVTNLRYVQLASHGHAGRQGASLEPAFGLGRCCGQECSRSRPLPEVLAESRGKRGGSRRPTVPFVMLLSFQDEASKGEINFSPGK